MKLPGTLLTCDLVCYGVASPTAFQEFLEMLGRRHGSPVVGYAHRGAGIPDRGDEIARFADGTSEQGTTRTRLWSRLWFGHLLRESCLVCRHHSTSRPGNVTLGDFWGLELTAPELVDRRGTSCVLVNDERGLELLHSASARLELVETGVEAVANEEQPMLLRSPAPADDGRFWGLRRELGFEGACRALGLLGWRQGVRDLLGRLRGEAVDDRRATWPVDVRPDLSEGSRKLPRAFAARNRSEDVRRASSSGGVFHALASQVIGGGGVVYGCAFDEELRAAHVRCETMAEVERCMGSKYSQSRLAGTLARVRADVAADRTVLFSGTPCQVAAARAIVEGPERSARGRAHETPPVLWRKRTECCGCTACATACPTGAITMRPDEKGFSYPTIDATRCVGCGSCLSACPW